MVELKKAKTEARDLEHMQLAEAVEVIAKSEDRRAKTARVVEGRLRKPDLVLREANRAKANVVRDKQMKETTKTNQKLTPRKVGHASRPSGVYQPQADQGGRGQDCGKLQPENVEDPEADRRGRI